MHPTSDGFYLRDSAAAGAVDRPGSHAVNDTCTAPGAAAAPGPRPHPGVREDSRLTDDLAARYEETGAWRPLTLRTLLRDAARRRPDRIAAVDRSADGSVRRVLTYAELDALAHAYACGLHELGVRAGDGVAVMLPNGADFAALVFAAFELGAVYTGVPASYGEREVAVILRRSRARVVVTATEFGRNRPLDLVTRVRPDLDSLRHVVVAGEAPDDDADARVLASLRRAPEVDLPEPDPRALCHVGFTSGTTGEPKGVINTHQTLRAVLENWVAHQGDPAHLGDPPVNLVASPVGHHTGFLWGVLLTTLLGGTAVYLDRWVPDRVPGVIRQEQVTTMFSAPTFLQDLLQTDLVDDGADGPLRTVVLAGAPVPRSLPERAERAFGARVCPAWGMTELGIGISCAPHLPSGASRTDGVAVPDTEVRVLGAGGAAAPGELGPLQIRGAGLFLGYLDLPAATAAEIDPDGWFTTGDTARIGPEGWVEIEGRTKDVVIRGGENIPVAAVESLLYRHPALIEAAVVGVPDPRLGERACAVVVPAAGIAAPTLENVCAFLTDQGLSRHFLPERLESLAALPKTASGKVRKVELRERYA